MLQTIHLSKTISIIHISITKSKKTYHIFLTINAYLKPININYSSLLENISNATFRFYYIDTNSTRVLFYFIY